MYPEIQDLIGRDLVPLSLSLSLLSLPSQTVKVSSRVSAGFWLEHSRSEREGRKRERNLEVGSFPQIPHLRRHVLLRTGVLPYRLAS